jgi:hypothetical protein
VGFWENHYNTFWFAARGFVRKTGQYFLQIHMVMGLVTMVAFRVSASTAEVARRAIASLQVSGRPVSPANPQLAAPADCAAQPVDSARKVSEPEGNEGDGGA